MALEEIQIVLPATDAKFAKELLHFLETFGSRRGESVRFTASDKNYVPCISIAFDDIAVPRVDFRLETGVHSIDIVNTTRVVKESPHSYSSITLEDFLARMSGKVLTALDHVGFDLPFFEGVHPALQDLRAKLKNHAAYFTFPSGEPWDFILPATREEIERTVDLSHTRRPKFEIASIDKTSTPIVQIDFMAQESYANIVKLFPEGISDPTLKNVWVYITNTFGIDFCFVVNEHQDGDWSDYFNGHRVTE